MELSIITPHYNDFKGIKQTYDCLKKQTVDAWEWVIVDDYSNSKTKKSLKDFSEALDASKIKVVYNDTKTNASVCRNIGIDHATFSNLVFLDSDDIISEDFAENRYIQYEEFAVFKNTNVLNEKGENIQASSVDSDYLNHFLKANFVWPITSVLWNKEFLIQIGKFNEDLERLQDIELSIRALFLGEKHTILDNKVDFFYCVKPIRLRKNFVKKVCSSVNYLIFIIHSTYMLDETQHGLIKGYYYLCVKYLHRSKNRMEVNHVRHSLKAFYFKKYISLFKYFVGLHLLWLYQYHFITDSLFLKINRYFFK